MTGTIAVPDVTANRTQRRHTGGSPLFLDREEAAEQLRISVSTLDRQIKAGKPPRHRTSTGIVVISPQAIDQFRREAETAEWGEASCAPPGKTPPLLLGALPRPSPPSEVAPRLPTRQDTSSFWPVAGRSSLQRRPWQGDIRTDRGDSRGDVGTGVVAALGPLDSGGGVRVDPPCRSRPRRRRRSLSGSGPSCGATGRSETPTPNCGKPSSGTASAYLQSVAAPVLEALNEVHPMVVLESYFTTMVPDMPTIGYWQRHYPAKEAA